jgi:hypothetical protein
MISFVFKSCILCSVCLSTIWGFLKMMLQGYIILRNSSHGMCTWCHPLGTQNMTYRYFITQLWHNIFKFCPFFRGCTIISTKLSTNISCGILEILCNLSSTACWKRWLLQCQVICYGSCSQVSKLVWHGSKLLEAPSQLKDIQFLSEKLLLNQWLHRIFITVSTTVVVSISCNSAVSKMKLKMFDFWVVALCRCTSLQTFLRSILPPSSGQWARLNLHQST